MALELRHSVSEDEKKRVFRYKGSFSLHLPEAVVDIPVIG